ncbi:putative tRNA-dihydrouridine synthase [Clavispora lusitaniae]|uniref:tRNA-dihydrouridine(20a/20b) synthase [NAD(P)+] n=1 Tax=Clavispora lusitaniae TaxID=36911 RepID=A0AA91T4I3_CLALS|nr:putative tRNA-dihydrouridine synthase [Clavispora lusitaniae]
MNAAKCEAPAQTARTDSAAHAPSSRPRHSPLDIFAACRAEGRPAYIAGPMVRYSKLPFRELVRLYNTDLVYSPMILAREFVRNGTARATDFSTNSRDSPLVVQVGASNAQDLVRFVDLIHEHVDAIGLNCGCPIRDQVREGIGAALMSQPENVASMVRAVKEKYGARVLVETKIRIHPDLQETLRWVKLVEEAGVDWITVHGRTRTTRSSQPANWAAIAEVKKAASVPVVANGDCFSLEDARRMARETGCDGVMAVRGILANPALFSGRARPPWGAIEHFFDLAASYGLPFRVAQHHLAQMMEQLVSRRYLREFGDISCWVDMVDWFDERFDLKRRGDVDFGVREEIPWKDEREKRKATREEREEKM